MYENLPDVDAHLVNAFWDHCEANGLNGWKGKVKESWKVPSDYPDREHRVAHSLANNLWHAHIGYPKWEPSKNEEATYLTSEYVIHFQYVPGNDYIRFVHYGSHEKPFELPTEKHME